MKFVYLLLSTMLCNLFTGKVLSQDVPVPSSGRVVRHTDIPSTRVPSRPVDVWLPPSYDGKTPHDILIMHDGQMLFDKSITWNGAEWGVDETLSDLITRRIVRPTLVVGVWNRPGYRHAEFTPRKPIERLEAARHNEVLAMRRPGGAVLFPDGKVESDAYLSFLVGELLPFLYANYATSKESGHIFLAGSSMGGLISLYGWLEYPEVFMGAACLSTHWPLGFDEKTNHASVWIEYLSKFVPEPSHRRLYMDTGDQELDAMYLEPQARVDSIFGVEGYNEQQYLSRVTLGHRHNEVDWAKRLPEALGFLLNKPSGAPGNHSRDKNSAGVPSNSPVDGGDSQRSSDKNSGSDVPRPAKKAVAAPKK